MLKLPRVKAGDPITPDLFNRLAAAAQSCGVEVGQGNGLTMTSDPHGITLGTAIPCPIWALITGPLSGGTYPFTEQFPAPGGTWTAGSRNEEAFEVNSNTSVPTNTYVRMWWRGGTWRFQAGSC